MKTLQEFLILARRKYLQARSLDYYLQTDEAQKVIQLATPGQKDTLYGLLKIADREGFCDLLDKIRDSDLNTMSVMVLRRKAQQLGILDYNIMIKEQLIFWVKQRQQQNAAKILADGRGDGEAAIPAG